MSPVRPQASPDFPWYDSLWLSAFERARATIAQVAPARIEEFEHAFDVLRTDSNFEPRLLPGLFDADRMERIVSVTTALAPAQLEMHEARMFKRFVVHNHPEFTRLQSEILAAVGEAAGELLEPAYNFLSLYGPQGVCPLHMDSPQAKWTLDLCIRQHAPWEIHFSPVVPWPSTGSYSSTWEVELRESLRGQTRSFAPQPGEAILFSGSSQWHFRDPIPADDQQAFCDLLFFHFIPLGTAELVKPESWARLFGIPELQEEALTAG
jgi:hypothetical protein